MSICISVPTWASIRWESTWGVHINFDGFAKVLSKQLSRPALHQRLLYALTATFQIFNISMHYYLIFKLKRNIEQLWSSDVLTTDITMESFSTGGDPTAPLLPVSTHTSSPAEHFTCACTHPSTPHTHTPHTYTMSFSG